MSKTRNDLAMYIILYGDPANGYQAIGPFDTQEDAIEFGDGVDADWTTMPMEPPHV